LPRQLEKQDAQASNVAVSPLGTKRYLGCRRPLIYVYELPSDYNTRMLQYRVNGEACVYRVFMQDNVTSFMKWAYGSEMAFHELLLQV
jgi:hypothetical protein